jgi:WD40 repeat protein
MAFSPDGKRLASGGTGEGGPGLHLTSPGNAEVIVWDVETGEIDLDDVDQPGPLTAIRFSPDGRQLAVASRDGSVTIRDARTGKAVRSLLGEAAPLGLAFSADGTQLAVGEEGHVLRVWDLATGPKVVNLPAAGAVRSVVFSPDGQRVAGTCLDPRTVRTTIWNTRGGQELMSIPGNSGHYGVAFSPDGRRLAAGGMIVDAATGQVIGTVPGGVGPTGFGTAFDPEGRRLAVADYWEGVVKLWDTVTGRTQTFALPGVVTPGNPQAKLATGVAFSPRGDRLAGASRDDGALPRKPGFVKVWDAATGRELLTLHAQRGHLWSVAFSPDGQWIAAGGGAPASGARARGAPDLWIWDAVSGRVAFELKGHNACVRGIAFSPDGKRLASAADARSEVKIWDLRTGQELVTLQGGAGAVYGVAFSPDGKRLATACGDRCVKLYGPPEPGHGGR